MVSRQRPINFTGPEVRATLAGRKSQFRRVLKPQPTEPESIDYAAVVVDHNGVAQRAVYCCMRQIDVRVWPSKKPVSWKEYAALSYRPGDLLWVRERFKPVVSGSLGSQGGLVRYGTAYEADGHVEWARHQTRIYHEPSEPKPGLHLRAEPWKRSTYMRKHMARIWLRVTDVRAQRVREISEADAIAEGVEELDEYHEFVEVAGNVLGIGTNGVAREAFLSFWDSLHKPEHRTEANPWVAAYTFERVEGP